jgi:hypothetical protein
MPSTGAGSGAVRGWKTERAHTAELEPDSWSQTVRAMVTAGCAPVNPLGVTPGCGVKGQVSA